MTTGSKYRVYGPPGTGKTTFLVELVQKALDSGTPGEAIVVCSFSRAAFREFRTRIGDAVPESNLGTIHSLAYRALGRPSLALSGEVIELWNEEVPYSWQMSPRVIGRQNAGDALDPFEGSQGMPGDVLYDRVATMRNTRRPEREWTPRELEFYRAWRAFMRREQVIDFPGMLEEALARWVAPAQRIDLLLVDEAQDLNPLQLALVEYWSSLARETYYIGDDDQAIYGFMGADGRAFMNVDVQGETVLSQSYRIPASVQAVAEAISSRIRERAPKTYRPRPGMIGEVRRGYAGPKRPHRVVEAAIERVKAGKTVLILAPTRDGLDDVKRLLVHEYGFPYANPYAWTRKDLNLFLDTGNGVPGWRRVEAFLRPKWTWKDLELFLPYLRSTPRDGVFVSPDAKKTLLDRAALQRDRPVDLEEISGYFTPAAAAALASRDARWLESVVASSIPDGMRRAIQIARRNPELVLSREKAVWVGTIHSVKGGEADSVFLFPYITPAMRTLSWDDLHRLFYVAVTRAREELVVAEPGAMAGYPIPTGKELEREVVL